MCARRHRSRCWSWATAASAKPASSGASAGAGPAFPQLTVAASCGYRSGAQQGADALRARSNQFTDTYTKTIGVDFLEKALQVDALGRTVRLQLWDTAGQEEFDALTRSYYRGALALLHPCTQASRPAAATLPDRMCPAAPASGVPGPHLLVKNAWQMGNLVDKRLWKSRMGKTCFCSF